MTILYFTSTGNCLMVAKKIGGNLISIPQAMKENKYKFEDDAIGLVYPVYGLSVPPIILEFLEKCELKTSYLFSVITYGTYDAGTISQMLKCVVRKDITFSYINHLHMQENYLPGFAMEKQKTPKNQESELNQICLDIQQRRMCVRKDSAFDRFMTRTHQSNYHYKRGIGVSVKYSVSNACTHCGTCSKVCPTGNIRIINGRPVFGKDCLSCLACTQNCPQNAIRLEKEKSEARYRNPEVSLSEIISANNQNE